MSESFSFSYLVGINSDAEKSGVCVDQKAEVARVQIVDNRGLREIGHVCHILQKFVLGRVLRLNLLSREKLFLVIYQSLDLKTSIWRFLTGGHIEIWNYSPRILLEKFFAQIVKVQKSFFFQNSYRFTKKVLAKFQFRTNFCFTIGIVK